MSDDRTRRRVLTGIGTGVAVTLAGCGGQESTETASPDGEETPTSEATEATTPTETATPTDTPTPAPTASLRVAHLSPNAPNVDVYADGTAVLEDVAFGAVSEYLSVPAGERQVEITAAGDPDTTVFSGGVPVEAGTAYTVAATGEIGDGADRAFEPLVLEDDVSSPGEDTARVRLLHASPDAPAVDVTLASSGDAVFDGASYGESATIEVPAGDYTLEVRGDTESDDGDVVAAYDVSLAGDTVYTAYAAGYLSPDDEPADTEFDLLVSNDTAGGVVNPDAAPARVRVAHLSPNAPNVDVYVDDTNVLEGVPFGTVSSYLDVPAGERQVEITAAGDSDATVFSGGVSVIAGVDYTVAATGEVGDGADRAFEPLVLRDDNDQPADDTARVRLLHASPDAPAVDVTLGSSGDVVFDGVAYGGSETVEVPAGDYTLEVRGDTESNDGDVVGSFDVSLAGGQVYSALAVGYLSPDDEPADTGFDLLFSRDTGEGGGTIDETDTEVPSEIDSYLADANGYDGTIRDATGEDSVTVAVGGDGLVFDPPALRIDAGTTVNWEWAGGTHNVVSTEESSSDFDSGDATGDTDTTFSQSFDDTGLQFYVCEVHASGMLGAIEVV